MELEHMHRLKSALSHRYAIQREIGRGGMATVYLAQDVRHGREVAIKVLKPELASALGSERFLREIRIAARLAHPHILPLFDSGDAEGFLFYVMPYVEDESLAERMEREGQLPLVDVLRIARQVGEALAYAHECGVIHRDIKPGNILFEAGHAVVTDFGIARAVSEAAGQKLTETGLAVGTPGYMSPEQAMGEADVDARSDQYSLACVLHEMLAGEPPKQSNLLGPSVRTARDMVPRVLDDALSRALAAAPADRFRTVSDFVAALGPPDGDRSGRVEPSGIDPPRWIRRVRGRHVLGVLGAAAVGWLVWALGPGQSSAGPQRAAAGPTHDARRIAVLYFADRSHDESLDWLAAGLTEDLIDRLSDLEPLNVISPSGVRPYAGRSVAPDSVGRALGVGTLVQGSVERSRDGVRVAVRIIEPATGMLIGRFVIEGPFAELLSMRDDVAERVSWHLRRELGDLIASREQLDGATSGEAWQLVRRALEVRADAGKLVEAGDLSAATSRLDAADDLLARAERLDPGWLLPVVERGWLTWSQPIAAIAARSDSHARLEVGTWLLRGIAHADRAMMRQPDNARALELRGVLKLQLRLHGDAPPTVLTDTLLASAQRDLTAATEADAGSARAWYALSHLHGLRGSYAEAKLAAEKALHADVYALEAHGVLAHLFWSSLHREEFGDADQWCAIGRRHFPGNPNFLECELTLLGWSGDSGDDASRAWQLVQALDTIPALTASRLNRHMHVAAILARAALPDSARRVLAATRETADLRQWDYVAREEAYIWMLLGERERAIAGLANLLERSPEQRATIADHPWYRSLHGDRRFEALMSPPIDPSRTPTDPEGSTMSQHAESTPVISTARR